MQHEPGTFLKHDPRSYDPEVHGKYQVHIGLTMPNIQSLILFLEDNPTLGHPDIYVGEPIVYVDGGGWTAWSEPVGEASNDAETYVVSIPVKSPRRAQQLIADMLDFQFGHERLVTIADQDNFPQDAEPVIAVVSDGLDHSANQHHLSWEYGTVGSTTPTGVYFSMWPKGRKAYHIEISAEDGAELENWLFSRTAEIIEVTDVKSGHPARRATV